MVRHGDFKMVRHGNRVAKEWRTAAWPCEFFVQPCSLLPGVPALPPMPSQTYLSDIRACAPIAIPLPGRGPSGRCGRGNEIAIECTRALRK